MDQQARLTKRTAAAALAVAMVLASAGVANAGAVVNARLNETASSGYGVHATWAKPDNLDVPCPNDNNEFNEITFFTRGNDEFTSSGLYLAVGVDKYVLKASGTCVPFNLVYWGSYDAGSGVISQTGDPVTAGGHDYAVSKINGQWSMRVDSGNDFEFIFANSGNQILSLSPLRVGVVCRRSSVGSNGDCNSTGETTPNSFTYKDSGGSWHSWTSSHSACADFSQGGRGKFTANTSGDIGMNVSIPGSVQNSC